MAADHRADWALREGDRLQCGDTVYIITGDPIGYGGSALVYPARRADTHLRYAIKECFPFRGSYERRCGVIAPQKPDDALSLRLLEHFGRGAENEQRIGQLIHNTSDRAVCIRELLHPGRITFRGESIPCGPGGVFALLDRMDLKSLSFDTLLEQLRAAQTPQERQQTRGLPGIHITACLMEEILTALHEVHTARDPDHPGVSGYYFGDLHGGNICFTGSNIREGITGTARLIDFGSARELDNDGFTAELTARDIYSAAGIRPPEILTRGTFRLNCQADLFSVGCLLLRCVATEEELLPYAQYACVGPDFLDSTAGDLIGCGPELLRLLNEILDRATSENLKVRYADAEEMLRDIRRLRADSAPAKYRLESGLSTLADGEFVGREKDRKMLDRFLEKGVNPIVLYGFPGLGKTELAIDYARRRKKNRGVCFVRFRSSFRETVTGPIADALVGYRRNLPNGRPKPPDQIYREVMELLRQCSDEELLIIDQADSPTGLFSDLRTETFEDLCRLPLHLILTTRSEPDGPGQWHQVGPLDRASLEKMILRHGPIPPDELDQLITATGSHTLTLDLIARTIAQGYGGVTPRMLAQSFGGKAPVLSALPEISTHHDRSTRRDRLYGHLKSLFDLSGMGGDEITVLCCATLLPSGGMNAALFQSCLEERAQAALTRLTKTRWITLVQGQRLCMQPVIREVCRWELDPGEAHWGGFLQRLQARAVSGDDTLQAADCFAASVPLSGPAAPYRASRAGALYRRAGQYDRAVEYAQKALELGRRTLSPRDPALASLYQNLGTAWGDAGDYDRELECQQEALRIRQALLPPDHPDLALSYSSVGTSLGDRGDHWGELDHQRQALRIRQAVLPPDHPDLADSYSKVGDALCRLGNHPQGVPLQRQALQLRLSARKPDRAAIAAAHNNLGKSLCEQGQAREALAHFREALRLREQCFPPQHPAIAQSHNNLAIACGLTGDARQELAHRLECLNIRRETLRADDPKLIDACRSVAMTYGKLRDRDHELEYFLELLELQTACLPEDDPKLAAPCCHLAKIYAELGIRSQQRFYLEKAALAGHTGSMNDLAVMFLREGDHAEALRWLREAYSRQDGNAANTLGVLHLQGQGVPRDLQLGHSLLLTAVQRGSRAAHRHLGRLYLGHYNRVPGEFPMDPARALHHLELARNPADAGLILQARSMLGNPR